MITALKASLTASANAYFRDLLMPILIVATMEIGITFTSLKIINRSHEFIMKLEGATYMDIHKIGGGINFTVKQVNQATEE
jgi:hypothetical protein